jgi:hypothetical protein
MSTENEVNLSEILADMANEVQDLKEDAIQRSEASDSVLDLFITIIQNDQARYNLINDLSFRKKMDQSVVTINSQTKEVHKIHLKKLELLKNQCVIAKGLIERANKEGVRII